MEIQVSRSAEEKKKNPDPFAEQEDSKDQSTSDDSQVSEAYAVIDDSGIIYQLTGDDYGKLMKCSYNDLVIRSCFLWITPRSARSMWNLKASLIPSLLRRRK